MIRKIARRSLFKSAAGVGLGSLAFNSTLAKSEGKKTVYSTSDLNLEDPLERAKIRTKLAGSIKKERVYSYYRLHIYAFLYDKGMVPLCTMNNLAISDWEPKEEGKYAGTIYEVGVYTNFDDDEPIEFLENPVTKEKREVWPFVGGPISVTMGPDGIETGKEAVLKPRSNKISVIGDTVYVPTESMFSFPNPMKPSVWPKESAGETYFWDSFFTFSADIREVLDPKVSNVMSKAQFQNLVSWHPWFGMGQLPGRTFGRAFGGKISSLKALPKKTLSGFEKYTPEIFDIENWGPPSNDFFDFMRERKPS